MSIVLLEGSHTGLTAGKRICDIVGISSPELKSVLTVNLSRLHYWRNSITVKSSPEFQFVLVRGSENTAFTRTAVGKQSFRDTNNGGFEEMWLRPFRYLLSCRQTGILIIELIFCCTIWGLEKKDCCKFLTTKRTGVTGLFSP